MGSNLSSMHDTMEEPSLSIFGYGSLLWNPGFDYNRQHKAIVRGYSRRFYQGNTTYRGTDQCPGRVVTLIQEEKSVTYGVVFTVIGRKKIFTALEHLYEREVESGYYFELVNAECLDTGRISRVLTFIASPGNIWYMGPSRGPKKQQLHFHKDHTDQNSTGDGEQDQIALDIAKASGQAGPNCEYLFKLAECMRKLFPGIMDDELFKLENCVVAILKDSK